MLLSPILGAISSKNFAVLELPPYLAHHSVTLMLNTASLTKKTLNMMVANKM